MGFLKREKKVVGTLGWVIGRGMISIGRLAVGGPTRRRATLALLAVGGSVGYVWLEWDVTRLLTDLLALVFGIPAPGKPLSPVTWVAPQTGVWPDIMGLSRVSMGLALLLVLALGGRATWASDERVQRKGLKRVGKAALLVATTWTLLPFGLHLANELARLLVPGPNMLLQSLKSTASGVGVLAVVALVQPLLVAIAVLAMAVLRALIIAGFVLWPLAWPLRIVEHDLTERLGRSITALLSVAVATKLLQAIGLVVMIYLSGAIESLLLRVLVFAGGTIGVFVVLPIKMLQHAERVMMLPGALAPSERQVGKYVEESSKRVGQAHRHLDSGVQRAREWHATSESREAVQTSLNDWNEATSESSKWWSDWISVEWVPSHSSAEWNRSTTRASMPDGAYGPDSDDPDDVPGSQDSTSTREQGRWDDQ